jgi:hypothetical protein
MDPVISHIMRQWGRRGGLSKSPRKLAALKANREKALVALKVKREEVKAKKLTLTVQLPKGLTITQ